MRFVIKHEIRGRLHIHIIQSRMTYREADILQYYLMNQKFVTSAKVKERIQDASICYAGSRETMIEILRRFSYDKVEVPEGYLQNSGRELNEQYWEKLVNSIVLQAG